MPKSKKDTKEKKVKASGKGEKLADMSVAEVVVKEEELEKELAKPTEEIKETLKEKKASDKPLKQRGKKYQAAKSQIDKNSVLSANEAFSLLKKLCEKSKFDQTVELHLNVLSKGLSGEALLPHFKGKARKIAIFDEKLAEEIKAGKINFDILLTTPADMPKILPFAKILGPKGLMPNPKNGTISPDPKKAMEKFTGGALYFKTEKDFPLIHSAIGKISQPVEELTINLETLIKAVNPKNVSKAVVKTTMSPGIKVAVL